MAQAELVSKQEGIDGEAWTESTRSWSLSSTNAVVSKCHDGHVAKRIRRPGLPGLRLAEIYMIFDLTLTRTAPGTAQFTHWDAKGLRQTIQDKYFLPFLYLWLPAGENWENMEVSREFDAAAHRIIRDNQGQGRSGPRTAACTLSCTRPCM